MTVIRQSSTHRCFVCGAENPNGLKMRFYSDGNGYVYANKTFTKEFQGYPGIVHGGIISAVLDEAAGRTHMNDTRPQIILVTGKLEVKFHKPVNVGVPLKVEAHLVGKRRRVYVAHSCIKNNEDEVLAEADVTLIEPRESLTNSIFPSEDMWVDWDE